jgi:hypothetical protein
VQQGSATCQIDILAASRVGVGFDPPATWRHHADEDLAVEVISTRGGPDIKANLAGQVKFSIAAGNYQVALH